MSDSHSRNPGSLSGSLAIIGIEKTTLQRARHNLLPLKTVQPGGSPFSFQQGAHGKYLDRVRFSQPRFFGYCASLSDFGSTATTATLDSSKGHNPHDSLPA